MHFIRLPWTSSHFRHEDTWRFVNSAVHYHFVVDTPSYPSKRQRTRIRRINVPPPFRGVLLEHKTIATSSYEELLAQIASSVEADGEAWPEPPSVNHVDIASVVGAFGAASARARAVGLKVIDIHTGSGFLLHQFCSPLIFVGVSVRPDLFDKKTIESCTVIRSTPAKPGFANVVAIGCSSLKKSLQSKLRELSLHI